MSDLYKRNLAVPFFTQRDNTYVWQQRYEKDKIDNITGKKIEKKDTPFGPKYPMAWRSCNITSLCMLLHYWGLTKETPNQMIEEVYSNQVWKWNTISNGHEILENWKNLRQIAEYYVNKHVADNEKLIYKIIGGEQDNDFSMDFLKSQIGKGYPVMLSTGLASLIDNTNTYKGDGHIVVVRGFTVDGDVILNDPFGIPVDNDNKIKPLQGISENPSIIAGWYYNSQAASIGDNIVIECSEFNKICKETKKRYLCIEGPLWQEPGGTETDLTNSYPIRSDNMWHDGIHLESANGFYSIGAGRLVAARNAEVEGHGSSSFALVKYHFPGEQIKPFYGLYMHLEKIDIKQELEDFFLKNNGTVSSKLKNTWYEQIFNNMLPNYMIINYQIPEDLKDWNSVNIEDYQKIYKAKINDDYTLSPTNEIATPSTLDGNLSRHMKVYLIPSDGKLKKLCDIENYKNINNLKFMVSMENTEFKDADGYYYFYCGTSDNRQLCCCKNNKIEVPTPTDDNPKATKIVDAFASYKIVNEASYKYYTNCLYKLYKGESLIFNKIDTNTKEDKINRLKFYNIINNPVLSYYPNYCENTKFLLKLQDTQSSTFFYLENTYEIIRNEIAKIVDAIELFFRINLETGKSTSKDGFNKFINDFESNLENLLKGLLIKISSKIEKKEVEYGIIEKKSDKEWMKELFEDAEKRLECMNKIGKVSEYNVEDGMHKMREVFKTMIDEYKLVNTIDAISICIFLMLEFVSIPKEKLIDSNSRFPFKTFNSGKTYEMLNSKRKEILNSYDISLNQRYIDNYIEVPKGAKIGHGSKIPDSEKQDSIHFEIFSKEELIKENTLIDGDDDNFYDPSVIAEKIIEGLNLNEEEKQKYLKFSEDGVITTKEILQLYTETDYLKTLVTKHRSEWKIKEYTEEEISKIVNTPSCLKKSITKNIEYYNNYYKEYNWIDNKMGKELKADEFYYYHPLYFIEKISEQD